MWTCQECGKETPNVSEARKHYFIEHFRGERTIYVCQYSGGVSSWAATMLTIERYGQENVLIWFADTLSECPDLYRFNEDVEEVFCWTIEKFSIGMNLWELFEKQGMIANTRADFCSRIMKRELLGNRMKELFKPGQAKIVLGMEKSEGQRLERARRYQKEVWGFDTVFPLADPGWPNMDKIEIMKKLEEYGIEQPILYREKFPHNNCGGFCVKAGLAQFQALYESFPDRYAYHEGKERRFRKVTGKDVSILRDRRGGTTKPMTLEAFRKRIEAGESFKKEGWGFCNCFVPVQKTLFEEGD